MSANTEPQNIFLIRHAKPELPYGGGVYYGSTDYPLSEEGERAAAALRDVLAPIQFEGIYSSDLVRARRTLELALPQHSDSIKTVSELREINLGEWEGKTFDEVRSEWNEIYEARGASFDSVSPPGGESFKELSKRTVPAFEKIMESTPSGNILIMAHGGVIWTIICHFFKKELNDMFFYPMDYCGIHVIKKTEKMLRLSKYNWSARVI